MKNNIIKTVCFSFLALSVALCAVFTLPKNDNFTVNAQTGFNPNIEPYVTDIPFDTAIVEYLDEGNIQSWAYFPIDFKFYDFNTPLFGYNVSDLIDNNSLIFAAQNLYPDKTLNVVLTSQLPLILRFELSAHDFYFDISDFSDYSPTVTFTYSINNEQNLATTDFFVTVLYSIPTPGEEATILTTSYGMQTVTEFSLYEVFNRLVDTDFSIIYIKEFRLNCSYYDISVPDIANRQLNINGLPYTTYADVEDYAISYFNQWDSNREVIEYQVDFFASIVQSVDSFMKTEFLPNVSFYDLLLFCIVIPLVVVVLKMWLGG